MSLNISDLKDPVLSETAKVVLEKRYLKRDDKGKVKETPREMFYRVAKAMAEIERANGPLTNMQLQHEDKYIEELIFSFYNEMALLKFLPNTPTLINAGRSKGILSACFVLPIEDSMGGIFDAVRNDAMIFKFGGGVGHSFSNLRPSGDFVSSTIGVSSGPVSFMRVFNVSTEVIKQGGVRRGAMMGTLRVDHPDILEFIKCKDDTTKLTNFNISVVVTDEFMKAVKEDKKYWLRNPRTLIKVKELRALDVFNLIVHQAWKNGEPGILFIDTINRYNPTPEIGKLQTTNPCGETPLLDYESCNLGSINISKFVKGKEIDFKMLRETVGVATRFLDNIIDANVYPLEEIERMTKSNRKIGLGLMGWADTLVKLNIPYNSEEAIVLAKELMCFIEKQAFKASMQLAEDKGIFPNFDKSIYKSGNILRNATLTTIAPTGTISMIAGCSSGIEPLFGVAWSKKNVLDGREFYEVNSDFESMLKQRKLYSKELIDKVIAKGTISDIEEIPKDMKECFVCSHDITPEAHIKMQAAFQMYTNNAVSKTINFAYKATEKDVREAYILAYALGCKGVTVYRDGSRESQILNIGKSKKKEEVFYPKLRKRPKVTKGVTVKTKVGCGNMYVTLNEDKLGLCELFAIMGKSGGCVASHSEAVSRLISLALRSGINPNDIVDQIKGIRCPMQAMEEGGSVLSCSDGIARVIERYLKDNNKFIKNGKNNMGDVCPQCPDCEGMLTFSEGCVSCKSCGYSRCG